MVEASPPSVLHLLGEGGGVISDQSRPPPSSSTAEKLRQNGTYISNSPAFLWDFCIIIILALNGLVHYFSSLFSIVENGQERVEVEEDGQLKSLTVNGKEQLLRLDNK